MEDTVDNRVVTSVGNSWIVCRSKSHPDRIYYFNTYTGEAAWNLSEVEIEKAKNATKIIEKSGLNMDGCPEPKDPPHDNPNYNTYVNKYFDKIPIATTTNTCNDKSVWKKPNQTHFAPIYHIPKNQCCNHVNTMSNIGLGYPMTCGLNPIWNVPAQQIPCNIPSIMNKSPYQMDLHHNESGYNDLIYVQSTSVSLNKRFESQNKLINDNSSLGPKIKDGHIFIENDKLHENVQESKMDLRDFISRKKKIKFRNTDTHTTDKPIQLINKLGLINEKTQSISKSTDTTVGNQRDVATGNPITQDPEQDTTVIKKNVLLHFKNIAKRILHKDLWYIVPDVNTLLYHQGFLKSLVQSDEECRLMVLENVMTDIRNTSRSDNIDAMNLQLYRRAMYYISQSIRDGVATIAKDPATGSNKSKSYILDCCLKLSKENYHFILLCNDKELHDHEKAASIRMFTVNEMKTFCDADFKERRKNILHMNQLTKITEPNKKVRSGNIEPSGIKVISSDNVNINMGRKINTVSTSTLTNEVLRSNKATFDVGIQANLDKTLTLQTKSTQTIQSPFNTNTLEQPADSLDTTGLVKRKDMKLIRSLSSQNSKKEDTGKKNYKWRRKRIVFNAKNNDSAKIQEKCAVENQSEVLDNENICKIDNPLKQPDNLSDKYMPQASVSDQNNCCENMALEETSTLGVMLKAQTNVSTEIVSSEVHKETSNIKSEENENSNCFMFEVTSQAMEEYLKTRRDEWVSRFLQIMEEVLTQLLQKDSLTSSLSPPWSVHEATQCIKMKYCENRDIVDAGNKLSEILFNCSDSKGKIDMNMSPSQFMKMYSYAVYLIDSLQVIVKNSEDLHIASESMAKLLNDIQNHNLDNSHNDSFTDITLETALDVSSVATGNTDVVINVCGGSLEDSTYSPRRSLRNVNNFELTPKYNLRSQRKRTYHNNVGDSSSPFEFVRRDDPESQFFTSLQLRKNNASCNGDSINIPDDASTITGPATLNTVENETTNNEPSLDKSSSEVKPKEQRIIRNFSLCADFEAKIKNKKSELVFDDINKVKDINGDDLMVDDNVENHEETNYVRDEELQNDGTTEASLIKNDKLKYVISMLVREIREFFLLVYDFCEESQRLLKDPNAASDGKLMKTAEEIHLIITQLSSSLNRIHNRDVTEMERLFAKFLDSTELKDLKFNENDFQEYRDVIRKCIHQANSLRDSIGCIMRCAI